MNYENINPDNIFVDKKTQESNKIIIHEAGSDFILRTCVKIMLEKIKSGEKG